MSRNRRAGHKWERMCRDALKFLSPYLVTSRSESRSRDAMKIDLMNNNEYKNGIFPFEVQCKSTIKRVDYHTLLNELPGERPGIVLHQYTEKRGTRFFPQGEYAIMKMDELLKIIKDAYGNNEENTGEHDQAVPE